MAPAAEPPSSVLQLPADALTYSFARDLIAFIQSRWRGMKQREKYRMRLKHFRDNEDAVIYIQKLWRGRLARVPRPLRPASPPSPPLLTLCSLLRRPQDPTALFGMGQAHEGE